MTTIHEELAKAQADLQIAERKRQDRLNAERREQVEIESAQKRVNELARQVAREKVDGAKSELQNMVKANRDDVQAAQAKLDAVSNAIRPALTEAIHALKQVLTSFREHENQALGIWQLASDYAAMGDVPAVHSRGIESDTLRDLDIKRAAGTMIGSLPAARQAQEAILLWVQAAKGNTNEYHLRQAIGWLALCATYNRYMDTVPNVSDEFTPPNEWFLPRAGM